MTCKPEILQELYLTCPQIQPFVSEYCWGEKCGKGIVGGVDFNGLAWIPCREKECPFCEKEQNFGEAEVAGKGENIVCRKLKEECRVFVLPEQHGEVA